MEEISYHLDVFEGPLDLLLTLIAKNKVEISDIPISLIFDQYMDYIRAAEQLNMELAGEFIVMAAQLMLIKSKMLLPVQSEDEEDPREALANALLEYNRVKGISKMLDDFYSENAGRFVKEPQAFGRDTSYVEDDSINRLERAFKRVLAYAAAQNGAEEEPEPENMLGDLLTKGGRRIPVPARIYGIMRRLFRTGDMYLSSLLSGNTDRADLITTFVAVLELLKAQRVVIAGEYTSDDGSEDILLHLSMG